MKNKTYMSYDLLICGPNFRSFSGIYDSRQFVFVLPKVIPNNFSDVRWFHQMWKMLFADFKVKEFCALN